MSLLRAEHASQLRPVHSEGHDLWLRKRPIGAPDGMEYRSFDRYPHVGLVVALAVEGDVPHRLHLLSDGRRAQARARVIVTSNMGRGDGLPKFVHMGKQESDREVVPRALRRYEWIDYPGLSVAGLLKVHERRWAAATVERLSRDLDRVTRDVPLDDGGYGLWQDVLHKAVIIHSAEEVV